jgi:peptide/nickel transport system permease protein
VFSRDYAVVQGITLLYAVLVIVINLVTDLTYPLLDPRVRLA